jgi:signal transduction histidine kinase
VSEIEFAELISKIAHELRSPLTSVKGFAATLVKRWDRFSDEQRRHFVETILADADRMARIVSEVLDLARLETGRLELHMSDSHVSSVVAKALNNVAGLPGAERVDVEVPEDMTAWADPERLEKVVTNLIENAIKFSDEGSINVGCRKLDGATEIIVRDHGVGIEPERVRNLFRVPAPEGQSAGPSGSGLGLYLTNRLVEAHGGTLAVESAPGAGSTFVVRLPVDGQGRTT